MLFTTEPPLQPHNLYILIFWSPSGILTLVLYGKLSYSIKHELISIQTVTQGWGLVTWHLTGASSLPSFREGWGQQRADKDQDSAECACYMPVTSHFRWVILPAKEFAYYHHHVHERRVFLGFSVAMNCRTYKRVPEPSTSYRAKPLVWGTHAGIFRLSMADTSKRTGSGADAVVETSSSYLGLAWDV